MNASLRLAGGAKLPGWMTEHLEGNRYVNAIYLCASGMLKFGRSVAFPKGARWIAASQASVCPVSSCS